MLKSSGWVYGKIVIYHPPAKSMSVTGELNFNPFGPFFECCMPGRLRPERA
jgi:hypothetical protein